MISGPSLVTELTRCGVTHVVWLPDSTLGQWETALAGSKDLQLVRVSREAEAWAIAAGLHMTGKQPVVIIQCTGLFDSGDSLRNFVHDFGVPLFGIIGWRSYLIPDSPDSAKTFTEEQVKLWKIDYRLIDTAEKLPLLAEHYLHCRANNAPGLLLLAEGKM